MSTSDRLLIYQFQHRLLLVVEVASVLKLLLLLDLLMREAAWMSR